MKIIGTNTKLEKLNRLNDDNFSDSDGEKSKPMSLSCTQMRSLGNLLAKSRSSHKHTPPDSNGNASRHIAIDANSSSLHA